MASYNIIILTAPLLFMICVSYLMLEWHYYQLSEEYFVTRLGENPFFGGCKNIEKYVISEENSTKNIFENQGFFENRGFFFNLKLILATPCYAKQGISCTRPKIIYSSQAITWDGPSHWLARRIPDLSQVITVIECPK